MHKPNHYQCMHNPKPIYIMGFYFRGKKYLLQGLYTEPLLDEQVPQPVSEETQSHTAEEDHFRFQLPVTRILFLYAHDPDFMATSEEGNVDQQVNREPFFSFTTVDQCSIWFTAMVILLLISLCILP